MECNHCLGSVIVTAGVNAVTYKRSHRSGVQLAATWSGCNRTVRKNDVEAIGAFVVWYDRFFKFGVQPTVEEDNPPIRKNRFVNCIPHLRCFLDRSGV